MDFQFHGANCLTVTTKQARLTVDDNLADLGAKPVGKHGDIALFTGLHGNMAAGAKLLIDRPGEYEVSGVSIYGIQVRAHMDEEDKMTATMYKLVVDDLSALITGHIYPELSDDQLEAIGMVDVLVIPVGGNGYTLDGTGALKLIKKIEPKLIVPTHYDDSELRFPVPQQSLEQVLKTLAMEPKETTARLKLNTGFVSESMDLIVVTRS